MSNNLDNIILSFFLEVRDEDGKLITTTLSNPHIDSSQFDTIKKIALINTCYTGIYYVKMLFYKSADIQFNLKFNEEESDSYIQLRTISAFPNQIVLSNKVKIKSGIINCDVSASNSNAEEICDERLNLYIEDSFSKSISTTSLVNNNGQCSLNIKLYDEVIIKSNIDNFTTEINNYESLLYSINPIFHLLKYLLILSQVPMLV